MLDTVDHVLVVKGVQLGREYVIHAIVLQFSLDRDIYHGIPSECPGSRSATL